MSNFNLKPTEEALVMVLISEKEEHLQHKLVKGNKKEKQKICNTTEILAMIRFWNVNQKLGGNFEEIGKNIICNSNLVEKLSEFKTQKQPF